MQNTKRAISLRLDAATMKEVETLAANEMRSISNMADILIRMGLRDHHARTATAKGKKS